MAKLTTIIDDITFHIKNKVKPSWTNFISLALSPPHLDILDVYLQETYKFIKSSHPISRVSSYQFITIPIE